MINYEHGMVRMTRRLRCIRQLKHRRFAQAGRYTAFMTKIGFLVAVAIAVVCAGEKPKVRLPTGKSDLAQGQKVYEGHCASCHGMKGEGGRGAILATPKLQRATDDVTLYEIVENGIRGTEMMGFGEMSELEMRQVAAYVKTLGKLPREKLPGDPKKGGAIYAKSGCATCHGLKQGSGVVGGMMGPELSNIGLRRNGEFLRASLIDPEASVPIGFMMVKVVRRDGSSVSGVRVGEDSFTIVVRDASDRTHAFQKSDLTDIQKQPGKSPMPSYKGQLSPADLDDLVAYLASLREGS
jgi:putative heme-binding domain-containing protein